MIISTIKLGFYALLVSIYLIPTATFGQGKLLSLTPRTIEANDGEKYNIDWGWMELPEDYKMKDSPFIEVPFCRLKTASETPLPPIFLLAGGPGDSPSILQELENILPIISAFTEKSDLFIIEQRGNGLSQPSLLCEGTFELPLDKPLTHEAFSKAYRDYMASCNDHFVNKGRMLSGYNVQAMVEDIEAIRKALDYDQIILFGGSFGSHHALSYINSYPQNVERALLDSPEGLTHTVKLPSTADFMLNKLSRLVSEDEYLSKKIPSFTDLVIDVLNKVDSVPTSVNIINPNSQEEHTIVLGKYDLQLITALELGREGYRDLPKRYLEMKDGDFSWAGNYSFQIRRQQGRNLMAVLTDCASGASKERWDRVKEERQTAILGDALNNIIFDVCSDLDIQNNVWYFPKEKYQIPILIIVGSLDARTPPSNAREIADHFEHADILIIENATHDLFREAFDILLPMMKGFLFSSEAGAFLTPDIIGIYPNLTH